MALKRFVLLFLSLALPLSAQTLGTFEVFPSVAVKGVTQKILLRAEDIWLACDNQPIWCSVASVEIGGVKSPSVTPTSRTREIEAVIPDLPAGTVADVIVRDQNGNIRRKNAAVRIVDPNAPYAAENFDRVLIPVIYEGTGQNGSRWTTDVYVMNTANYDIAFMRGPVAKLESEQLTKVNEPAPNGYVLYPVRNATDDLAVNVLVRDLSRQSEALGTELPAVRESQFENRRIMLMNVPSDPKFRLSLRAYAFDGQAGGSILNYWLYDLETGEQAAFGILRLTAPSDEHTPWTGTVDLMAVHPEIANKGPLRLSISPLGPNPAARFWAFVSITNNDTQHVTAITPNP